MARLTADDVLNKKLPMTRHRGGYEQDAVDESLDEVIDSMRYLEDELVSANAAVARLERATAPMEGLGGVTPGA